MKERAQPQSTPQAEAERQARIAREAAALRANLRRRKDQVRARVTATEVVHGRLTDPTSPPAARSENSNILAPISGPLPSE